MRHLRIFCSLLLIFALSATSFAQTYQGRILGTVTDESGGAVRGAKVIITNTETGVSRSIETNDSGDYAAPNLPPGLYTVIVEASGFKKVERAQIRLEVAKDARIDIALPAG